MIDADSNELGASAFLGVIRLGILLSTIAILIAVIIYFLQRKEKRASYLTTTQSIISSGVVPTSSRLEVYVNGQKVDRVFVSRVVIWNSGDETIHGSNLKTIEPARIIIPDGEILHAELEKVRRPVNNVKVEIVEKAIPLCFDYLDPRDGYRIIITHSGSGVKPKIEGQIIGLPYGIRLGRVRRTKRWSVFGYKFANPMDFLFLIFFPIGGFIIGVSDLIGPELNLLIRSAAGDQAVETFGVPNTRTIWRGVLLLICATIMAPRFWETFRTRLHPDLVEDLF